MRKFSFLLILFIVLLLSLSCKSGHSKAKDDDLLTDSDNFSDIDTDSDIYTDFDIDIDKDAAQNDPDLIIDEQNDETDADIVDIDTADEEIVDIDTIDVDITDENITETDIIDEDVFDTDFSDIDTTDENLTFDEDIPFDEDYITDDEIISNCVNGICDVPSGRFVMGCSPADLECNSNENPRHSVVLSSYKIMEHEVTVGEFEVCITAGNCNNSNTSERHYTSYNTNINKYCNLSSPRDDTHPMNCVSWYGAKAYCEWIGMRLPTEAEWEYAAKGNDNRIYPWGDVTATCDYAVMKENESLGCELETTWIVGSKTEGNSPFGASDMAGNVIEWCEDWYSSSYYSISPKTNPKGASTGSNKVLRGGSWYKESSNVRTTSRFFDSPAGNIYDSYGFRCAAD